MSRITHRKGLSENLPQLTGAELGWALDDRRLYIGNGKIEDGAPVLGNTEILTEFSDILSLSGTYTYQGLAGGYQVDTGGAGEDIQRSLVSKFDDIASVKDFGAVGDGVTDDTLAINRALFELFCRGVNPAVRRGLLFPAGIYLVTDIIKIPPFAKLLGEGLDSSVIKYEKRLVDTFDGVTDEVAAGVYQLTDVVPPDYTLAVWVSGPGFLTEGVDFTYSVGPNQIDFNIGGNPVIGIDNIKVYIVAPYCVTTSDNDHIVGTSIGDTAGTILPTGIEIASMGFESIENNTIVQLNSVVDSSFESVKLSGPQIDITTSSSSLTLDTAAIEIVSLGDSVSSNITFSKMNTHGTTYGLRILDNARGIILESSKINTHYIGVYLDENPGDSNKFPTGVVVTHNIFDNIALEGVKVGDIPLNLSSYNIFYNVGNDTGLSPISPNVSFANPKCISLGDLFERTDADNKVQPRILLPSGLGGIAIDNTHSVKLGSYERSVGIESTINATTVVTAGSFVIGETYEITATGTTDFTLIGAVDSTPGTIFIATGIGSGTGTALLVSFDLFTFESAAANSYKIDYNIFRNGESRMGTMFISTSSLTPDYNEEFTQSAELGVVLSMVGSVNADSTFRATVPDSTSVVVNFSVVRLD